MMSETSRIRVGSLYQLFDDLPRIKVVDVGASAIDGAPVYQPLVAADRIELIGFEPDPIQFTTLQAMQHRHATYLCDAIGDGRPGVLHVCEAPGMTSLLEPDMDVLKHFPGFRDWGAVTRKQPIETRRLEEIAEANAADFLKLDVQGAELTVLQHARPVLEHVLVVHTEVQFVPFYKQQPLFAEIDQALREAGFFFHRFLTLKSRVIQPTLVNNDPYAGLSQQLWSDAVYAKRFTEFSQLDEEQLLKIAVVMNDLYGPCDLAVLALRHADLRRGTNKANRYVAAINALNDDVSILLLPE